MPLFAALLSLPLPAAYAPLTMSPEQQKQQTLHALLTILLAHGRAAAAALGHGRPALGRSLDAGVAQSPGRSRPDRPHPGPVHLSAGLQPALDGARASHPGDAAALAAAPGRGDDAAGWRTARRCPPEVVEQIVAKTDGVPLFVEELTKMVLESGLLQEQEDRYDADRAPAPAGDSQPRCTTR